MEIRQEIDSFVAALPIGFAVCINIKVDAKHYISFVKDRILFMSDVEKISFNELELKVGQSLEIQPGSEQPQYHDCIFIGCLPDQAIIVGAPMTGEFPVLEEGQKVVIRAKKSNGVAVFPSTALFISDIPTFMVYLDYPEGIKYKSVRRATRVDVNLPILASSVQNRMLRGITGKILDISTLGARVVVDSDAGSSGDSIELKGKFDVGGIQRILSVEVVIRSKVILPDGGISYGVEFQKGDEENMLVLFGYIFNAMAFGKIQSIR